MSTKEKTEIGDASLFLDTLNSATDEDICPYTEEWARERKRRFRSELYRYLVLLVCMCVAMSSVIHIIKTLVDYRRAENFYAEMFEMLGGDNAAGTLIDIPLSGLPDFGSINGSRGGSTAAYNNVYMRMRSEILKVKSYNEDVFGWVVVPGTDNISYPVLQGTDNDYYLSHVYTHAYMPAGSIFADYHCYKDTNMNFNTVLYGHNMQNGLMFSELIKFMDEEFFNENEYIYLCTEGGIFTYRIFAAYKTDYRSGYVETGFPTAEDFVSFAEEMRSRSAFYREGIEFTTDNRIITLSTCTNTQRTDRYCVQGLLVDAYNVS